MCEYFLNIMLALDVLASAILKGMPGVTLSGRAGIAARRGSVCGLRWALVIDTLAMSPGHCARAVKGDRLRASAVIADDRI